MEDLVSLPTLEGEFESLFKYAQIKQVTPNYVFNIICYQMELLKPRKSKT